MNFYIASSFSLIDRVEAVVAALEARGHEVPVKWWTRLHLKQRFQALEPDAFYAEPECEYAFLRDMKGIHEADAVILVADDEPRPYCGANVEVGIAIGIGRPVFSLGRLQNSAMYWPVKRCRDLNEILATVEGPPKQPDPRDCPSYPCPTPEQAKGCWDCQCDFCPDPSHQKEAAP